MTPNDPIAEVRRMAARATNPWRRSRLARPFTIGVALGGGAARGLAHIGVLKVLEREGILPQVVAGTSAGALVGAAYAWSRSVQAVEERFVSYASGDKFRKSSFGMFARPGQKRRKNFFQQLTHLVKQGVILGVTATKPSFISAETFSEDLHELLPDVAIEELPIRFAAIATDIVGGEEMVLAEGPLMAAVAASCALPGVLPPVSLRGTTLIDGGSVNKVPARTARQLGADFVVAVDIHAALEDEPGLARGIDIVSRSHAITSHALRRLLLAEADIVIRPEVGQIHWADFGRYAELIRLGEGAAQARVADIRRALRRARWRALLMPWTRPRLARKVAGSSPPTGRDAASPSAALVSSSFGVSGRLVAPAVEAKKAEV